MSRTRRRLPLSYRGKGSWKWFKSRFSPGDYTVVKSPRRLAAPQYMRMWKTETRVILKRVDLEFVDHKMRQPNVHYGDFIKVGEDSYIPTTAYRYVEVPKTYTYRALVRNPDYDEGAYHQASLWESVHHEIFRNGSCRRQRINGVRLSKRIGHHVERRSLKDDLNDRVEEYFINEQLDREG